MKTPLSENSKSISSLSRIMGYFTMWGLDYGFIFGFAAGSMVIPGFGTIIGAIMGLVIGGLYGMIAGLGISATYKEAAPQTDLDAQGQKLVRRTAGGLTALNVIVLPIVLFMFYSDMQARIPIWDRGEFPEVVLRTLVLAGGALSILMAFVVAATVRHFPHWMAHERRLSAPMAHAFVMRHEMETTFHQIRKRSALWWLPLLFMSLVSIVFLMNPAAYSAYTIRDWLSLGGSVLFLCVAGTWVGRIYLSLVNAAVLTFIKRVILRDYFPNLIGARYRARVTLIALIATLIATWWTFFLAPVIALVMAYFVYHTVALPDEMQEKSKRKEADISTEKTKVPSSLMLPEETDGELIDLHRLADPSATQAQQS